MEACGSAHYWGRTFEALGHTVVLLPPHLVKPYITRNKTDRADAKGILEAYRNDQIHRVPIKTLSQQTLGAVHRLRSRWIKAAQEEWKPIGASSTRISPAACGSSAMRLTVSMSDSRPQWAEYRDSHTTSTPSTEAQALTSESGIIVAGRVRMKSSTA